tara:strand:- start:3051 stop:3890 length:840 start_codon:yes stop_codon:yes gene_type:complete
MVNEIDKVVVFGANGLIGSSFCKFLELNNHDFLAISKSKENKNKYKNYFSLDLDNDDVWPQFLIDKIKNYNKIIFLSAVAHKKNIDVLKVNTKIFKNFISNIDKLKKSHSLLFISSQDIKFLKRNYAKEAKTFQISYAKSKKICEEILKKQTDLESKILRLPTVFSSKNMIDLRKRYCISANKVKIYFKILPAPLYEIISTDELNLIFLKELKFEMKPLKNLIVFKKISQHDLLSNESNFYIPIPRVFLYILFLFFSYFPFKIIKSKAIYFDKLINITN